MAPLELPWLRERLFGAGAEVLRGSLLRRALQGHQERHPAAWCHETSHRTDGVLATL